MDPLSYNLLIDSEIRVIIDKTIPYLTPAEVAVINDIPFLESLYIRIKKVVRIINAHRNQFNTKIHDDRLKNAISFLRAVENKFRMS
jgi:hypothetical protein